jgi:quercetin dioxygenase-like cupin family protein
VNTHTSNRKTRLARWPILTSLALTIVLSVAFLAVSARAQESDSPVEGEEIELPPGVSLTVLSQLAPFDLPDEPVALLVGRLVLEPGAGIPRHPHHGGEFGFVEAGTAFIHTFAGPPGQVVRGVAAGTEATPETGEDLTINTGDFAVVPAGNESDTRAGDDGATILIFEFAPLSAEATPAS